jgi:hypothetical protein
MPVVRTDVSEERITSYQGEKNQGARNDVSFNYQLKHTEKKH